jgi:hypothetical protein
LDKLLEAVAENPNAFSTLHNVNHSTLEPPAETVAPAKSLKCLTDSARSKQAVLEITTAQEKSPVTLQLYMEFKRWVLRHCLLDDSRVHSFVEECGCSDAEGLCVQYAVMNIANALQLLDFRDASSRLGGSMRIVSAIRILRVCLPRIVEFVKLVAGEGPGLSVPEYPTWAEHFTTYANSQFVTELLILSRELGTMGESLVEMAEFDNTVLITSLRDYAAQVQVCFAISGNYVA